MEAEGGDNGCLYCKKTLIREKKGVWSPSRGEVDLEGKSVRTVQENDQYLLCESP